MQDLEVTHAQQNTRSVLDRSQQQQQAVTTFEVLESRQFSLALAVVLCCVVLLYCVEQGHLALVVVEQQN